eukprot:EC692423.1.p2 GENE.EC692423.1~~EC692423.1.p2  ORF type:complete len:217 (+),score=39.48 EC692423.1:33-653(+)
MHHPPSARSPATSSHSSCALTVLKLVSVLAVVVAIFASVGFIPYNNNNNYNTNTNQQSAARMSAASSLSNVAKQGRHLLIVGGGLAGLSAAVEATRADRHVHVTIIEKLDACGGNSAKASSGMSAAVTNTQLLAGIPDTPQAYLKDTLSSGDGLSSEELVTRLVANSPAAIDFLQSFGIPWMSCPSAVATPRSEPIDPRLSPEPGP